MGHHVLSNIYTGEFFQVIAIRDAVDHEGGGWIFNKERSIPLVLLEGRRKVERFYTDHMPTAVVDVRACGFMVCENHFRDLGRGIYQCAAHWPEVEVYSGDA